MALPPQRNTIGWVTARAGARIEPWADQVIDRCGSAVLHGDLVETEWLPIIGPTGYAVLRRLNAALEQHPAGVHVDWVDLARQVGVGWDPDQPARWSPLSRGIAQLVRYELAATDRDRLLVRRAVQPVPARIRRYLAAAG